jgi:transposase-like protein
MRKFPELSSYWSEDEGRRVVEAWQRSGENATAFARRHGLRAKRLVYWSKRLALATSMPAPTVSFVPAAVVAADEVAAIIRAPGGIAIELASASPEQIAAVAHALARLTP